MIQGCQHFETKVELLTFQHFDLFLLGQLSFRTLGIICFVRYPSVPRITFHFEEQGAENCLGPKQLYFPLRYCSIAAELLPGLHGLQVQQEAPRCPGQVHPEQGRDRRLQALRLTLPKALLLRLLLPARHWQIVPIHLVSKKYEFWKSHMKMA